MPDRKVKEAQADNLRIEGKYIAGKAMAQILQMKTEAKTKEARLALDRLIADFDNNLKASNMAVNEQNIAESKARTQLAVTENLMRQKQLEWLPMQQKIELAQAAADIALKRSTGNLNNVQARHEVKKIAETVARTNKVTSEFNAQEYQNQFAVATYRDRVTSVRVALWNAVNEGLPRDIVDHMVGKKFQYDKFSDY